MADPQNATKQGGLTRGKAILIAVLGVVLVGVLYMQFGRGGAGASSEPSAYVPRRVPALAKIEGLIGYKPVNTLDDILEQVIDYFRKK